MIYDEFPLWHHKHSHRPMHEDKQCAAQKHTRVNSIFFLVHVLPFFCFESIHWRVYFFDLFHAWLKKQTCFLNFHFEKILYVGMQYYTIHPFILFLLWKQGIYLPSLYIFFSKDHYLLFKSYKMAVDVEWKIISMSLIYFSHFLWCIFWVLCVFFLISMLKCFSYLNRQILKSHNKYFINKRVI